MRWGAEDAERGSVAIEAAMLVPVFIVIVALVIAAGRVRTVDGVVAEASRDAARAASLETTPGAARTAGAQAAGYTLSSQGLTCRTTVSTADMVAAPGRVGTVQATVYCKVSLSDLLLPGVPGSVPISSSFTAVVDAYRSR